jgi:hypothetical protein
MTRGFGKSEIRKPKLETNAKPKEEIRKRWRSGLNFCFLDLGFVSDFEFRISNFDFAAFHIQQ